MHVHAHVCSLTCPGWRLETATTARPPTRPPTAAHTTYAVADLQDGTLGGGAAGARGGPAQSLEEPAVQVVAGPSLQQVLHTQAVHTPQDGLHVRGQGGALGALVQNVQQAQTLAIK
jgi:hypothetical protein